jgi:nitrite reductase/ring-hydroxylating ferredoxin subunit
MSEAVRVSRLEELVAGQPRLVEVNGVRVVLARVGDSVYACGEVCVHQGGPLSEGTLSGARLACPWHGWQFDMRTGNCLMPTRGGAVPSYPVRIDEGEVWVDLNGSAPDGQPGPSA